MAEKLRAPTTIHQFARAYSKAQEYRESSYDDDSSRYLRDFSTCARMSCIEVGLDVKWALPMSILLMQGYADMEDWCKPLLNEAERYDANTHDLVKVLHAKYPEIIDLYKSGKRIDAIKAFREKENLGLKEAHDTLRSLD